MPPRLTVEDTDTQSAKRKTRPQPPNVTGSGIDRASECSQSRKRAKREPENVESSSTNLEENRSQMETPVCQDSSKAVRADPKMSQYPHKQRPIFLHFKTTKKQNDPPNYPPADPKQSNTGRSRGNSGHKGSTSEKVSGVKPADHEKAKQ